MKCIKCVGVIKSHKHKFCSKECYWKSLRGIKGENAPNYKKVVGKSQVHHWLGVHYGKPRICEDKKCDGRTKERYFDWALKTGYKYERKRENFLRMCRSCHRRYDLTPEKRKQAIKNLWWRKGEIPLGRLIEKGQILNPNGYNRYKKRIVGERI